jgi:hypothetical protein
MRYRLTNQEVVMRAKKVRPKRSTNPTEPIAYAAGRMGTGLNQAYAAADRGEIPVIRVGKRKLVLVEPFERMLAGEGKAPTTGKVV